MIKEKFTISFIIIFIIIIVVITSEFFFKNKVEKKENLNILLITLDTTRADSIGSYGNKEVLTPNIDWLSENGIMFKNCYAPTPITLPSHCSIFTSRYPIAHRVRVNGFNALDDNELTLTEILKANEYKTSAFISSFTLMSKFGLNQGFDIYNEMFDSNKRIINFTAERTADKVFESFDKWLKSFDKDKFFSWVHFYDPHLPYNPHTEIDLKFNDSERKKYYGEISFVDIYIGKIIHMLKSKKLLDNTLIVTAGDHGEAFGEHSEFGHGIFCYEECIKVPLIFFNQKLFRKGKIIKSRVNLVDIMPTVLKLSSIDLPSSVQGEDLDSLIKGNRKEFEKRTIYFESLYGNHENNWAPLTGIIQDDQKFISLPEPELYDLEKDNNEKINLVKSNIIFAKNLDKELKEFISIHSEKGKTSRLKLNKSDLKKLETLGYISAFSNKSKSEIDPKEGISLHNRIEELNKMLNKKEFELAKRELSELAKIEEASQLSGFYKVLFRYKKAKGEDEEALEVLLEAVKKFPEIEAFKILLSIEYINKKMWERAIKLCHNIIKNTPGFSASYFLLGDIYKYKGNTGKAIKYYGTAVKAEPQNGIALVQYITFLVEIGRIDIANSLMGNIEKTDIMINNQEHIKALIKLVRLLIKKNQLEKALTVLNIGRSIDPKNSEIWLNFGAVYFKYKDFENALKLFKKAIDLNPRYALAYSNIGHVYITLYLAERKDYREEAMKNFNRAIEIDSNIAEAYDGIGSILLSKNHINEAIENYKKALELKPKLIDSYFNISYALLKLGKKKTALKYLKTCKENYYKELSEKDHIELDKWISNIKKKD